MRPALTSITSLCLAAALACAAAPGTTTEPQSMDFVPGVAANRDVPSALLATPPVMAEAGFIASVVVPPGQLYDPLSVIPRGDGTLWVNDDGGVSGDRGGYVWAVEANGTVTTLVGPDRMMPSTGVDVAPAGFGAWGGQLLTLSTRTVSRVGVRQSHIIERVPPLGTDGSTTICSLPDAGSVGERVAGGGIEARFGPADSPFANRFFSIAIANNTIYQTTADGRCEPFATLASAPWGLAFTPDGSHMLVTVRRGAQGLSGGTNVTSTIVSVGPDGTIDATPVVEHTNSTIFDVEVAPLDFGDYGGEIFFTEWGGTGGAESENEAPEWDGALYRVGADGVVHLVASGFSNPAGIAFAGNAIWVADVNRDGPFFERAWVADGFLVRVDLR